MNPGIALLEKLFTLGAALRSVLYPCQIKAVRLNEGAENSGPNSPVIESRRVVNAECDQF